MHTERIQHGVAVLTLLVIVFGGCGSKGTTTVPIRGEVLYNGAPLKNVPQGLVRYMPKTPESGRQASGRIQPDGSFVLTTFKQFDGVVPGDYNIVISAYSSQPASRQEVEASGGAGAQPRLIIPKKYLDPTTSGISDIVDSGHSGFKRIDLTN
ncbi:MAG: hypothetical protein WD738_10405 [Pirellulales bacterium]